MGCSFAARGGGGAGPWRPQHQGTVGEGDGAGADAVPCGDLPLGLLVICLPQPVPEQGDAPPARCGPRGLLFHPKGAGAGMENWGQVGFRPREGPLVGSPCRGSGAEAGAGRERGPCTRGSAWGTRQGHSPRGGRRPAVHHVEKVLQQLLPPVEVTELLSDGPTEGGVGEVFQGINVLPWWCEGRGANYNVGELCWGSPAFLSSTAGLGVGQPGSWALPDNPGGPGSAPCCRGVGPPLWQLKPLMPPCP